LDDRLAFFASDDALLLAARLLDPHHLRFMGCGASGRKTNEESRFCSIESIIDWCKTRDVMEGGPSTPSRLRASFGAGKSADYRKAWARADVWAGRIRRIRFWTSKK